MTTSSRPILFNGPMVRAILAGTKTQTRRIVKPQPAWVYADMVPVRTPDADPKGAIKCPYGQPGDRLWVRESGMLDISERRFFAYSATPGVCKEATTGHVDDRCTGQAAEFDPGWKSIPSIHMPRWASRITLEITGVRVERLQDISETDAAAEGVATWVESLCQGSKKHQAALAIARRYGLNAGRDFRGWYAALWESINGSGSFQENSCVRAVEFKLVEA